MFATFLLEGPGRRIPEVEDMSDGHVIIVEEIAVLNVRVRPFLPIDGVRVVDLAVELLSSQIVCHCVLRGIKTDSLLWQANRDVYDNLRLIFDELQTLMNCRVEIDIVDSAAVHQ